jgi:hypothetical protein
MIKAQLFRHWKDHFKNDRISDQDNRLKSDRRSDQDHPCLKNYLSSRSKIIFCPQGHFWGCPALHRGVWVAYLKQPALVKHPKKEKNLKKI